MSLKRFDAKLIDDAHKALSNNSAPWQQSLEGNHNAIPRNAFTGNPYHGRNLIRLVLSSQFKDTRWASFEQIKRAGGRVKAKEKATEILMMHFPTDGEKSLPPVLKPFKVFNLEQTTIAHYPIVETPTISNVERLKAWGLEHLSNQSGKADLPQRIIDETTQHSLTPHQKELSAYLVALQSGMAFKPRFTSYDNSLKSKVLDDFKVATCIKSSIFRETRQKLIEQQSVAIDNTITAENFMQSVFYSRISREEAIAKLSIQPKVFLSVPFKDADKVKALPNVKYHPERVWHTTGPITDDLKPYLKKNNNDPDARVAINNQYYADKDTILGNELSDFAQAAEEYGLDMSSFDGHFIPGKKYYVPIHNYPRKQKSGQWGLFENADGTVAGYFLNYKTKEKKKWLQAPSVSKNLSAYDKRRIAAERKQQEEINQKVAQYTAFEKRRLNKVGLALLSDPDGTEEYVRNKGMIYLNGIKKTPDGTLIIPLTNGTEITSLQAINSNGKFQQTDGLVQSESAYFALGKIDQPSLIVIGEGVSTTESLYQIAETITGNKRETLAIAAMTASNLKGVTQKMAQKYPEVPILIGADNDLHNTINPNIMENTGLVAAIEAAAIREDITVVTPPSDHPTTKIDWNDFYLQKGIVESMREFTKQVQEKTLSINHATHNKEMNKRDYHVSR